MQAAGKFIYNEAIMNRDLKDGLTDWSLLTLFNDAATVAEVIRSQIKR
jgi:hypothetical protein